MRGCDMAAFVALNGCPSASYVFSALRPDSANGQHHDRVRVAPPNAAAPAAGYPMVYLLDGNAASSKLDERLLESLSMHGDVPVLVFIADDSALRIDAVERSLDDTPACYGDGRVGTDPLNPQRRTGGAAAFAQLIATRIRLAGGRARGGGIVSDRRDGAIRMAGCSCYRCC
ncbi:hypothetical protein [Xanthomonas sp. 3075]|uniref:hypothetical protein n=1 Tax=Xanthomonas sp. 3075 TaxID=3035315 RepID=UPI0016097B0A|nr:hypothetical protein [Xanthomonas sp. 3075]MBB4132441.1 putative alpha/beta superfamily hydrolase [Xanthomonas sp. 3075]